MVIEQVSQRTDPEVHSRRLRGPQGPDPPALLVSSNHLEPKVDLEVAGS